MASSSSLSSSVLNTVSGSYGAGFDSTTLVSALVSAQLAPVSTMQEQQTKISDASNQLATFSSQLAALSTAANRLAYPLGFNSMVAGSSDNSIAATAIGTSTPGSYSVKVLATAQQQRTYSDGQPSNTGAMNMSGTLSLQVGSGAASNVNVDPTDSLADIATKISSSGARVTANVVYDGAQYHLMVRGLDTGAANAVTFGQSGFDLGLNKAANTAQKAQDASVQMDGITFTRPTNQVSGVIPGVTLAVTQPGVTSDIEVAASSGQLESQISSFVSAYNAVVSTVHTQTGYGTTTATNSLLAGDHAMRSGLAAVSRLMASSVPGASGAYSTLSSVGVKLGADGTLSFDSSAFESAMTSDPASVSKLFVTDTGSGATGIMKTIVDTITGLTDPNSGGVAAETKGLQSRTTSIAKQIVDLQAHATQYKAQLEAQFLAMNTQVAAYKSQMSALTSFDDQMKAMNKT